MNLRLLALATALTLSLWPTAAGAYCRTNTCDPSTTACPEEANNPGCISGGASLFWPMPCIGVALQQDASSHVSFSEFDRVVRASIDQWNEVRCGGQAPTMHLEVLGTTACTEKPHFNDGKGNANILMFRDVWPYENQAGVLALTTLTYGVESGEIYDADMEIKSIPQVSLTTGDSPVHVDLQSILTHELGHLLGLAHSAVSTATMKAIYTPGDTSFRTLDDDDAAGLCASYPANRANLPACDARAGSKRSGGYSPLCSGDDKQAAPLTTTDSSDDGCGCSAVGKRAGLGWWIGGLAVGLAAARRWRRGARLT